MTSLNLLFLLKSSIKFVTVITEEKLVKLSKVIEYIHQRPQQMNVDVTLSLTIVQGKIIQQYCKFTILTSTVIFETLNISFQCYFLQLTLLLFFYIKMHNS